MANSLLSLPTTSVFLLLLFFTSDGIFMRLAKGQASGQGAWCVAKPSSSDQELNDNINYACNYVDCSLIKPGGPCLSPDHLINHASVVMNLYYQKMGRNFWNCDFKKSGIISVTDPSYGDCKYAYSR